MRSEKLSKGAAEAFSAAAKKYLESTGQSVKDGAKELKEFALSLEHEVAELIETGTAADLAFIEARLAGRTARIASRTLQKNNAELLAIASGILRVVILAV